jgi:hypothetical protein
MPLVLKTLNGLADDFSDFDSLGVTIIENEKLPLPENSSTTRLIKIGEKKCISGVKKRIFL